MLTATCGLGVAATEDGTALLDVRSGQWVFLDVHAARVWDAVTRTGEIDTLIAALTAAGNDADVVRPRVQTLVDDWLARGLIVDQNAATAKPPSRRRRRTRGGHR